MRAIAPEEYEQWVQDNRSDYIVVDPYVTSSTKILHKHVASGLEWKCSPEKFKTGVSHPTISRKSVMKRTPDEYYDWIKQNNLITT